MNEQKTKPRVEIPNIIAEEVPPHILTKLQAVLDRIVESDGPEAVDFKFLEKNSRLDQLEEKLEQKIIMAVTEAIASVTVGLPGHVAITIFSRLLGIAAAQGCKPGAEATMLDILVLKVTNDFEKVAAVLRKDRENAE